MGVCSVCNGFHYLELKCKKCNHVMTDSGRIMDFYDDYSAYMSIDLMKMENGYADDYKKGLCPHLVTCNHCGSDTIYFIKE